MSDELQPFRVYVDGIWDLFHEGHRAVFTKATNKAKEFAGSRPVELVVGVCGEGVAAYKRNTIMTLDERVNAVAAGHFAVVPNSPIYLTEAFLDEHKIDLVVHGDDFSNVKKMLYYGAAVRQNKYASVPYTKGVSTTELLIEAKMKGTFTKTENLTQIPTDELISRIQERSWEELNIKPPLSVEIA